MDAMWELKVASEVGLAMLLGGLVGLEREAARKPAGFRTHMLVAGSAALIIGAGHALVLTFGEHAAAVRSDPIGLIGAIVTGVSFLGAGTIFRRRQNEVVEGLTTAASLLFCAALGVCVSLERFVLALSVTALALLVLRGVRFVERWIGGKSRGSSAEEVQG
jgi:putative Mg2+ transporter-C (MgtC) family protein